MSLVEIMTGLMDAYRHACGKHPSFVDSFTDVDSLKETKQELKDIREINSRRETFDSIACEEVLEIIEAVQERRVADAIDECYQLGAVAMRAAMKLGGILEGNGEELR